MKQTTCQGHCARVSIRGCGSTCLISASCGLSFGRDRRD